MKLLKIFSFEQMLKIGFTFSILLLLVASVFSFFYNHSLIDDAKWVDHTNEVIEKLNNIHLTIKDARISQRNFILSKEEEALRPFINTYEEAITDLNNIVILTQDNPGQLINADTLRIAIEDYFKILNWGINEVKKGENVALVWPVETKMLKISAIINVMQREEHKLLKMRTKKFNTSSFNMPVAIIVFSILALSIVILSYQVIIKNLEQLKESELRAQGAYLEIQSINEEISATNEELRASNEELFENREKLKISYEELTQNQQKLEASEERLLETQSMALLGNWEWDVVNNTIYWSEELKKIFDFDPGSPENFDYETYLTLLYPEDREMINETVSKALKDFIPYTLEHRVLRKDGTIRWTLARGKPVLSEGRLIKLVGATLDITDLRRAEAEQQKLAALVDNCFDFIAMADLYGNIEFINEAGRKLMGLNAIEEIKNITLLDYFLPEERDNIVENVFPQIKKNGHWEGSVNLKNFKTNQSIPVSWNAFLVKDYHTNLPIGIACISQDLTEIKKRKREIQNINNELSAAVEELKQAEENLILNNRELEARILQRTKDLAKSDERFQLISQATKDGIWDWDLHTNNVWWNDGFKSMFGYNNEEIKPGIKSWNHKIHPDDRERVLININNIISEGKTQWTEEYRFLTSWGNYIHVLDRSMILNGEDGRPYRMLGSIINVSDQKKLEEERQLLHQLAENERLKLYSILIQAPAAIALLKGRDLVHEMANELYYELTGNRNILGVPAGQIIPKFISQDFWEAINKVYLNKQPFFFKELAIKKRDDSSSYFNLVIEPIFKLSIEIEAIMIHGVDVTEQVLARKLVEESAERLTLLLEVIPQMAWTSNPKGEATFYNQKWYEFTGSYFDELKDWGWEKFLHPDDIEFTFQNWNTSLATGEIYQLEYRWKRASDNSYRWMLGRALPVRDNNDEIVLWVGTCTDIHDQKSTEADLSKKNQELIKINELLDTFVYTAAHDLKAPVINLKSLFQLIQETEDEATKNEYYKTVSSSVKRLEDTINGLVDVIDIQNEDNKVSKSVELEEVINEVKEDFGLLLQQLNGKITYDLSGCPNIFYLKSYIHSIFTNLIGNSIKYRSEQRNLLIKITSRRVGEYIELLVEDNGIGIDLNKFGNKLFKAFHRFTRNNDGKGLGLYLIKTMVERNGGRVEIQSLLNVGTTFKLYLKEYS